MIEKMMWRRFQTLLIAVAAGVLLAMLMSTMCVSIEDPGCTISYTDRSQFMIFTFTTFALAIVTIGYFRKRIIQMRLCCLNSIMLLFYQIWLAVTYFQLRSEFYFNITALFPAIAIILLLMACKYIMRDESMVVFNAAIVKKKKNRKLR